MRSRPADVPTWATYAKAAREAAGLSQTQLARTMGVARNTIGRWESGQYRPDKVADVVGFARATGCPVDEAMAAAGFRPDIEPPAIPTRAPDPELDIIAKANISDNAKRRLIERMVQRRLRDQEARIADLEDLIRAQQALER